MVITTHLVCCVEAAWFSMIVAFHGLKIDAVHAADWLESMPADRIQQLSRSPGRPQKHNYLHLQSIKTAVSTSPGLFSNHR